MEIWFKDLYEKLNLKQCTKKRMDLSWRIGKNISRFVLYLLDVASDINLLVIVWTAYIRIQGCNSTISQNNEELHHNSTGYELITATANCTGANYNNSDEVHFLSNVLWKYSLQLSTCLFLSLCTQGNFVYKINHLICEDNRSIVCTWSCSRLLRWVILVVFSPIVMFPLLYNVEKKLADPEKEFSKKGILEKPSDNEDEERGELISPDPSNLDLLALEESRQDMKVNMISNIEVFLF